MGPRKTCALCNMKKNPEISLHGFPKDQHLSALWKEACGFLAEDNVSNVFLCSHHFKPEDFILSKAGEKVMKRRLKANSVPLHLTNTTQIETDVPKKRSGSSISEDVSSCVTPSVTPKRQKFEHPSGNEDLSIPSTPQCVTINDEVGNPQKSLVLTPEVATPKRAKRSLFHARFIQSSQRRKIRTLQQNNRRLLKRISSLNDLVNELRKKALISEECGTLLMDRTPETIKEIIQRRMKSKNIKYSPKLRSFALTLQFYSTRAYEYVRKTFSNLLPHPSTLRKWYTVVDGKPGFTEEAFHLLKQNAAQSRVICSIVLDEMAIRTQVSYKSNRLSGYVDLGYGDDPTDACPLAKNALVFMAVGVNSNFKVPLGYFLINSLNSVERANLLTKCLELLHDAGVICQSICFDGASVNIAMAKHLGANFDYGSNKAYFPHPNTQKNVYVFWDPCHMLKLIRNALGEKKVLFYEGEQISWQYIESLVDLQNLEGLHLSCKLTKRHIHFEANKMNVRLAAQVLSESVNVALTYLSNKNKDFQNAMPTAKFALHVNNAFDMLNCRYLFHKRKSHYLALNDENYVFLKESSNYICNYLANLKDENGVPVIQSNRKTGFLGFIICLKNMFNLYDDLKQSGLKYLLTFKLSQDHIETFFSAIRARGGFNNNPNSIQFQGAYKRLLVKCEVQASSQGNCLVNDIPILFVSSNKTTDPLYEGTKPSVELATPFEHDYVKTMWELSPYVEDVVSYIAGFVSSQIMGKISCSICKNNLISEDTQYELIRLKNRGAYVFPSKDTVEICKVTERVFRQYKNNISQHKHDFVNFLTIKVLPHVLNVFNSTEMLDHIKCQEILDNHKIELIKIIISKYLTVRVHHQTKAEEVSVRSKFTKLILFKNQ